jgi:hypothetical protein
MTKKVKINPVYDYFTQDVMQLWGVDFKKQNDGSYVAEVTQELADEMVENKRAVLVKEKASKAEVETPKMAVSQGKTSEDKK